MSIIRVNLGAKSYNIEIAAGLLDTAGEKIRSISKAQRAAVISDSNVDALYGERLQAALAGSGFKVTRIVFPAGEKSKCLAELAKVYDRLAEAGITRSDLVVALGGGVTGDLGGFAAATFLRGVIMCRFLHRFWHRLTAAWAAKWRLIYLPARTLWVIFISLSWCLLILRF